jgi:fermentation-respiration switch protein FrsA (DUF1100 family)
MKPLMITAAVAITIIAGVLILAWTMQRGMMYFPMGELPAAGDVGLTEIQPVTFDTSDGLTLHAWFVAAPGPSPRATVVVFSGNAGNRAYRAPLAAALQRHGFHVLLTDYRGYGGNPGTPTQSGLAADSRAARAYLVSRADVDASRIVYFGESLGTAVAVDLAVDHPPAALVLRSPFTSMGDVGQHHYPFLPVRLLLRDRFAAIDQIQRIRVPLLVIAGGNDRIVPIEHSRRLYEAANEPKTLLVIPNADHNDYDLLAGEQMIDAIVRFLQSLV